MNKNASIILSAYSFVFKYPLDKLLESGYQSKNGKPIPSFDESILINLCNDAKEIFEKENNTLQIDGDVMIVGDIHGSLHDLFRILNYFQENQKKVLFLGDYIDRGSFSLECITILFALKVMRPDLFFLIRGNHEFDSLCSNYGFKNEILDYYNPKKLAPQETNIKNSLLIRNFENNEQSNQMYHEYLADHTDMNCYTYSETLYDSFLNAFSYLPICAIVNNTTFCIHGGLTPKLEFVDDINKLITRPINKFDESPLFSDVVWSDPTSNNNFVYSENVRGRGYQFNRIAVSIFLNKNSLKRIIRVHECVKYGTRFIFENKCITVFSASSYSQNVHNFSGILELFQRDDRIDVKSFPPIERLQKSDTIYYKVQNQNQIDRVPFSLMYPFLNYSKPIKLKSKINNCQKAARKSHDSIKYAKSSQLSRPSFTTKQRKSFLIHPSPSTGNLKNPSEIAPKLVTSHSMPHIY